MNISVVIASSRSNDLVKSCVESLEKQTIQPLEILLVVDRPDQEEEFKLFFKRNNQDVTVYSSGETGVTPARNKGVSESKGDIVAFIDDDATAVPTWVEEIVKTFESGPGIEVVGGPVIPVFRGPPIPEKWFWIIGCTSTTPLTTRPISCNMAMTRRSFDKVGGFDEVGRKKMKPCMSEETELCERIEEKIPGSITWNHNALVYHNVPETRTRLRYMVDRAYKEGVGKAVISQRYPLGLEKKFLNYYLTHPDRYTIPLLLATGLGFIRGRV
jgi:glucosyl-dolichyl phosphate glucuronosyltransferase